MKSKIISLIMLLSPFLLGMSSCSSDQTTNMIQFRIDKGWTFHSEDDSLFGAAIVPGTVHTDLLNNGFIEDPFYRTNEKELQWIDKKSWYYTTDITLTPKELDKENVILCFKGLDTYADIYFNGQLLLSTDNMFREWVVEIKGKANLGINTLKIYFHSPVKKGLELLDASNVAYPANNDQSENGGLGDKKVSVFTRKAAYHYGWDWGPRFVTSGIWRHVELKAWDELRILNVFIKQPLVTKEKATLESEVNIEANHPTTVKVILRNKENGKKLADSNITLTKGENKITLPFTIQDPELWWSAGLGKPELYQFEVEICKENQVLASENVTTGLRSIKLIRDKDKLGESFYFELNGIPVFAKGANYIPNDNFLPRVSSEQYKKVIQNAVDANMNMLRIWGGGIYEDDYFYELCDKNGILVWQDFMFACSMYPGGESFLKNIEQEAIDNVVRLRNHPCIALWCGNNEINTAWHFYSDGGWGWKEHYTKEEQENIQEDYLTIFHSILPKVVEKYTDKDDYWPSSPQAGYEPWQHAGYKTNSGDVHYWGVWHGLHPLEDFDNYTSRFMSEYGFQSFPDFETVKKYAEPQDFNIESEIMAAHQRSGIGNLRIKEYMGWYYEVPSDFEQFLYLSQVLQARGIGMAIEAHRRAMPYCMGSLYWQINDCWPVASWSSTDYYMKWKALHYTVKKAFAPVFLSTNIKNEQVKIYGISDKQTDLDGKLILTLLDFEGNILKEEKHQLTIRANTSTLLYSSMVDDFIKNNDKNKIVLRLKFIATDQSSYSNICYFSDPKDLVLPSPNLKYELLNSEGKRFIKISTDKIVRNLYINFRDKNLSLSDNYSDLLPNESRLVEISGSDEPKDEDIQLLHLKMIK